VLGNERQRQVQNLQQTRAAAPAGPQTGNAQAPVGGDVAR
jgi:hypothetical protein